MSDWEPVAKRDNDRVARVMNGEAFEINSDFNVVYNCAAWAVGDQFHVWDDEDGWWPPGVRRGPLVEDLAAAYGIFGFKPCQDDALEPNVDKIAIFAIDGRWVHACRQYDDGRWWSKLGELEDVLHSLSATESIEGYGQLAVLLRRERKQ